MCMYGDRLAIFKRSIRCRLPLYSFVANTISFFSLMFFLTANQTTLLHCLILYPGNLIPVLVAVLTSFN